MEFKKKTIIWEDNNEPPKDYIWAKKDGRFYEYSYATRSWVESKTVSGGNSGESGGSDDGGGGDVPAKMTMYDAWVKAFKTLQTNNFPVTPKKFAKGLISSYAVLDRSADSIFIPFINENTSNIFEIPEEEDLKNILDIQDVPDDIYNNDDTYGFFLYDLDDLTQLNDLRTPLASLVDSYGMVIPHVYEDELTHYCTNILKFNGKNYVWFQDWD